MEGLAGQAVVRLFLFIALYTGMDRSFISYYLNRAKNFTELAAEPIPSLKAAKGEDEQQHEIRKIPIYMDKSDIAYLEQFPPSFWPQALAR